MSYGTAQLQLHTRVIFHVWFTRIFTCEMQVFAIFTCDGMSHNMCYLACLYMPRVITQDRQNVQFIIHVWLDIHES